jgi:heme-degrading monooxygenase HmoA
MICRIWRGLTRADDAERYVEHLHRSTLPQLRELPGFVDASILRRDVARGTEFVVVTHWSSLKAIEQFAGADYTVAVVPPEVQRLMIDYDHAVHHYDVVD